MEVKNSKALIREIKGWIAHYRHMVWWHRRFYDTSLGVSIRKQVAKEKQKILKLKEIKKKVRKKGRESLSIDDVQALNELT